MLGFSHLGSSHFSLTATVATAAAADADDLVAVDVGRPEDNLSDLGRLEDVWPFSSGHVVPAELDEVPGPVVPDGDVHLVVGDVGERDRAAGAVGLVVPGLRPARPELGGRVLLVLVG